MVLVGGEPFGWVDEVRTAFGLVAVGGWAIDPDTADPVQVHVYIDSVGRILTADAERADVGAAYPGYGSRHGFSATYPISPGTHQVCVYAINTGAGTNRLLACRTVTA
jgi:hypothetical protein